MFELPPAPTLCAFILGRLFDAAFTFWGALLLSLVAARAAPHPALAKWVLLVPFVKLLHDAARGVPAHAYSLSA